MFPPSIQWVTYFANTGFHKCSWKNDYFINYIREGRRHADVNATDCSSVMDSLMATGHEEFMSLFHLLVLSFQRHRNFASFQLDFFESYFTACWLEILKITWCFSPALLEKWGLEAKMSWTDFSFLQFNCKVSGAKKTQLFFLLMRQWLTQTKTIKHKTFSWQFHRYTAFTLLFKDLGLVSQTRLRLSQD